MVSDSPTPNDADFESTIARLMREQPPCVDGKILPDMDYAISTDLGGHYDQQHDRTLLIRIGPTDARHLRNAFQFAHIALEEDLSIQEYETSGSTASVLTYDPLMQRIITGQLGDSACRACIISPDGNVRIVPLTKDQSFETPEEQERAKAMGGNIYNNRLAVTGVRIHDCGLGTFEPKKWRYTVSAAGGFGDQIFERGMRRKPDIREFSLFGDASGHIETLGMKKGDRLIVFAETDGTRVLKEPETRAKAIQEEILNQGMELTPESLADHFIRYAKEHGVKDNKSCVAVEISLNTTMGFAIGAFDGHGFELVHGDPHASGQLVAAEASAAIFSYLRRDLAL